jgi:hypothetical protein
MQPMSDKPIDLAAIERLMKAATPGPWEADPNGIFQHWSVNPSGPLVEVVALEEKSVFGGYETTYSLKLSEADAEAIVALVNAAPELIRLAKIGEAAEREERGRAPRWIPIEERLPEFAGNRDGVTCNVVTKDGNVMALDWRRNSYAKTDKARAARWTWQGKISPWEVTHWMPLPQPPERRILGGEE